MSIQAVQAKQDPRSKEMMRFVGEWNPLPFRSNNCTTYCFFFSFFGSEFLNETSEPGCETASQSD